ncbi:hypothetical protein CONSTELLA_76 [Mycobacterium phage Constella]|uniref:DNA methyltransferase n=1 Tax=Mycobacterium phage Wanda TaxID=1340713 RepID=UPI000387F0B2|nr:DNA methyltransferase [Mycobacterium phage Wanda]AGT11799.1 hypothetical protein PBI_WANDA_95 [Mycobacterium phage Wanda]ATN89805.1 hypothetical protein SEA_KLEIN_91 [Mycobacterium phage Klein]AXF51566.1 hypothetical protein CONSTELLA_76 [Mycobacterium phage Constella]AXQ62495.1 hypothetical protein SEA_ZELINK_88 [Mycobacterium phage Zelink]
MSDQSRIKATLAQMFRDDFFDETRVGEFLEALKANRIALVELPDPIVDEEWGDKYWPVPQADERLGVDHGRIRIDEWPSGPRIGSVSVHTPIRPCNVLPYVAALLAAAAEVTE